MQFKNRTSPRLSPGNSYNTKKTVSQFN